VTNTNLRRCLDADRRPCEELFRDTFWDLYRPGCVEHFVAHRAWDSPDLEIALLAEQDRTVGCLIATRAHILGPDGQLEPALYLGPLAVLPQRQHEGIGTVLMNEALTLGTQLGFGCAFLFGDPGYYARFGFRNASELAVTTADGQNFDAFMGIQLRPPRPQPGRLQESTVFEVDPDRFADFEAGFPPREQHVLPGQLFG